MVCKCRKKVEGTGPVGAIADSDIMVEPSTAKNVAKINGNMLGAVGFDTEVLQFVSKDGELKDVLVTYDSYCSHSMMDFKLATDLGLELECLGNMTTHSFMGNTR